jgi:hypothetical protein
MAAVPRQEGDPPAPMPPLGDQALVRAGSRGFETDLTASPMSDRKRSPGSSPGSPFRTSHSQEGPVAQWLEPAAHNGLVAGSSPARPTTHSPYPP